MAAKQKKSTARPSVFGFLFAVVLLLWIGDGIRRSFQDNDTTRIHRTEETAGDQTAQGSTDPMQVQDAGTGLINMPNGFKAAAQEDFRIHCGKLLLIDGEHLYAGTDEDMTTFASGGNGSYYVSSFELPIRTEVIRALNAMCSEYGQEDLMVYSTTAPMDSEYALYGDTLPDRVTGYCVDLCIWDEEGNMHGIGEPVSWITENAYRFGFVQSYTQEDAETTGIAAAPYHLRYVGEVHARLMHDNDLTFQQYLSYVKDFTADMPLYATTSEGLTYQVYYVAAGDGTTSIPVPENGEYEISGNNVDGFVVTARSME